MQRMTRHVTSYNADLRVQTKKTGQVARMQLSVTRTLLLALWHP